MTQTDITTPTGDPWRTPERVALRRLARHTYLVCRATVSFRSGHFFRMFRDSYQLG